MAEKIALEECVIGILSAVASADGKITDAERGWWRHMRHMHALFVNFPSEEFDRLMDKTRDILSLVRWREAISIWASDVPRDRAEMVYHMAVELQLVDGASPREQEVTSHLAGALGLSFERALQVHQTVLNAAPRVLNPLGSAPIPRNPDKLMSTRDHMHNATKQLFADAKVALGPLMERHGVHIIQGLLKPMRDDSNPPFGDYGWVVMWENDPSSAALPVMYFGFAIDHSTGKLVQMVLHRRCIAIETDDILDFQPLYEVIAEELTLAL